MENLIGAMSTPSSGDGPAFELGKVNQFCTVKFSDNIKLDTQKT